MGMPRSARYWDEKAAEAGAKAEFMLNEAHRKLMLRISRSYERD